jgi:hypothetical protein
VRRHPSLLRVPASRPLTHGSKHSPTMFRRLRPRHNPDDPTAGRRGKAKAGQQARTTGTHSGRSPRFRCRKGWNDHANREQFVTADAIAADAHVADGLADCNWPTVSCRPTAGWQAIITM